MEDRGSCHAFRIQAIHDTGKTPTILNCGVYITLRVV